MSATSRPTRAELATMLAFESGMRQLGEQAARLRNVQRLTVNIPYLAVRLRAEIHPTIDTELACAMIEGHATDAHWAGLAVRAGCATPNAEQRARILLTVRQNCENCEGYHG